MTYTIFQMREEFRQSLIRDHLFYVEQARQRLLPQFEALAPRRSGRRKGLVGQFRSDHRLLGMPEVAYPKSYFPKLDACRLVVNVYKHGKGTALNQLRSRYPEYLADPFGDVADFYLAAPSGAQSIVTTRISRSATITCRRSPMPSFRSGRTCPRTSTIRRS